jgi:large subunit ribosomal protein L32
MTPLPKRRHSTRRGGKRVAATKLLVQKMILCPACKKPTPSHKACIHCGVYKGKTVKKQKVIKKKANSK